VNPNIIKTVIERNWVRVVGTRDVPGRPELLGTTKDFLDYFGLRTLDELPPLAELKAMGEINLQLDLAKPAEPGSDDGSSGAGGASGMGEGGASGNAPPDSSVAAASADDQADDDQAPDEGDWSDDDASVAEDPASAAPEGLAEVAMTETAATHDDAQSEPIGDSDERLVASASDEAVVVYEHDPAATITHVDIESDSGDATVEVEALQIVEQDVGGTQAEDDEPADDEEELSAGPQSSTELVAAPRDRDD
jgi:segregation and condensation protein B